MLTIYEVIAKRSTPFFFDTQCTPCFKKTPTHIIGYKLRTSCLILIIFDTNIPHKNCHHMTAQLSTSPN